MFTTHPTPDGLWEARAGRPDLYVLRVRRVRRTRARARLALLRMFLTGVGAR